MQPIHLILLFICFLQALASCAQPAKNEEERKADEAIQNNPPSCNCCVFGEVKGMKLSHIAKIAPDTTAGERIKISGIVYRADGTTPVVNAKMYFYHTNNIGKYGKLGTEDKNSHAWWHGYCRGWLQTNEKGEYEINTIRPVAYPNRDEPAHIHISVEYEEKPCFHLVDFFFKDDKLLTNNYWSRIRTMYKKEGNINEEAFKGITLSKNNEGMQEGKKNIILHK